MTNQREFKFRAWHKERKEMLEVAQLRVDYSPGIFDQHDDFHGMEDIVLMQYTGEKDKEGKEIYEGDILEFFNKKIKDYVVIRYKEAAYFIDYYDNIFHAVKYGDAKIIGNIYENNDLFIN